MPYQTVEEANQHSIETLEELERRARDLVNILKGGIDVGQSGTLGDLALLDNANQIPQFVPAVLDELQKYGTGITASQPEYPKNNLDDNPLDVPAGTYRATTNLEGHPSGHSAGVITISQYASGRTLMLYESIFGPINTLRRIHRNGSWEGWVTQWDEENLPDFRKFGLGDVAANINSTFGSDLNYDLQQTTIGTSSGEWANGPTTVVAGVVLHMPRLFGNHNEQVVFGINGVIHHRAYNPRDGSGAGWKKVWDTGNTTTDSNGFIKEASPILRLGAQNEDDQHALAGAGTANGEAKGVTAEHIGAGIYRVSGAKGLAAEGWRIELPRSDDNSHPCLVATETADDGTITVRVYRAIIGPQGNEVPGEPMDVPAGRWADMRLLMPTTTDDEGNEVPNDATPGADATVNFVPPWTYKLDIWDRMTDAEAETFETEFENVGAKMRGVWRDCRYINHDSPLLGTLRGMMVDQWGEARTDELLAPS